MDEKTIKFILEHDSADTGKLLLSAGQYPEIDVNMAVRCIEARKKLKHKIPLWFSYPSLKFPFPLALEQCSSETSARYKSRFLPSKGRVGDLTGGLGIDSYFFSLYCAEVEYFEKNPLLVDAASYNFKELSTHNIKVNHSNINVSFIDNQIVNKYDLIYLDPSRRSDKGERIYSITECEPNFLELKDAIFSKTERILLKVSPMADISSTLKLLPETTQLHVLSVENECKELLFLLEKGANQEALITAVNIEKEKEESFNFTLSSEKGATATFMKSSDYRYLYEPNKSILKSGAFISLSSSFHLDKIAPSTHLYLSEELVEGVPGRTFRILEILDFNKRGIAHLKENYPGGNVIARNFPLSSEALRKRLAIPEGDIYSFFGALTANGSKKLFVCKRI